MTTIEKIRAEIEKLKIFYGELHTDFVCEKLLSFLDTIEPGKPMNQDEVVINGHKVSYDKDKNAITMEEIPNDLEEAANYFAVQYDNGTCDGITQDCFIAGAKWQKEQYHFFNEAWADDMQYQLDRNYENGKQAMKEQMLKEAVEGEVIKDWDNNLSIKSGTISGFKFGEKVRVIVCKKEGRI